MLTCRRVSNSRPSYYLQGMRQHGCIFGTSPFAALDYGTGMLKRDYDNLVLCQDTAPSAKKSSCLNFLFCTVRVLWLESLILPMNQHLTSRPVWISSYLHLELYQPPKTFEVHKKKENSLRYDFNPLCNTYFVFSL